MELEITGKFRRRYKKKPPEQRERITKTLQMLRDDPHHPGLHTKKIGGTQTIFECYADDSHRVTFEYGKDSIILRNNCDHDLTVKRP